MKFYVAAFPDLGTQAQWIHEVRVKHDPLAQVVKPHLTLIFPTALLSRDVLQNEVSKIIQKRDSFNVVLRSAMIMPDVEDPKHAHVFLVPDEGFSQILQLHDELYAGKLKSELRLDIPFVPHMTVAAGLSLQAAKNLADQLNAKDFAVEFEFKNVLIMSETAHANSQPWPQI